MKNKSPYDPIQRLVAHGYGGVTVTEMGIAAHALSVELGIPVSFVHNDRAYQVSLEITEMDEKGKDDA
jgi:hypothetical protein